MKDKFTILSSSYNKASFLRDWANSILVQTYRPLEVVIADDKSEDKTQEILKDIKKDFINKNIELKIINNDKRLYCGSSYRNLVKFATGLYFGVLDADDMLMPDAVEYVMSLYKNEKYKKIAWIYTQYSAYDKNMKRSRTGFCRAPEKGESLLSLGERGIHGYGHWRTFNYKIEKKEKLFCKNLTCSVDKYMGYRLEENGIGLFIDRICYKYRCYPIGYKESVSSTKYAMRMWEQVKNKAQKRRIKYKKTIYPILEHKN